MSNLSRVRLGWDVVFAHPSVTPPPTPSISVGAAPSDTGFAWRPQFPIRHSAVRSNQGLDDGKKRRARYVSPLKFSSNIPESFWPWLVAIAVISAGLL